MNKNIKYGLFFILAFPLFCFSQNSLFDITLSQGFAYGKTKSRISADNYTNLVYTYSLGGAANIEAYRENHFVSLALAYARRGYGFRIFNFQDQGKAKARYRLHYITSGIFYHFNINSKNTTERNEQSDFDLYLGLYTAYKIGQKSLYNGEVQAVEKSEFDNWDWGIGFGGNWHFKNLLDHRVNIGLKSTIGLEDITAKGGKMYLRAFELILGLPLPN